MVKVYPVVAGDGVPLFGGGFRPLPLRLRDTRVLDRGTAVLRYVPA